MTDPIADMLTRIRNALVVKHDEVEIPSSKVKCEIAKILVEEGFVQSYKVENNTIVITLKYGPKNEKVISGIKRISKPGLRVYANIETMPVVLGGMGIAILSTNKGIMTNKQAKAANVGGEVLAYIW
jgi:small subunit ribosomal protein S8